jgi:hypothetical protein
MLFAAAALGSAALYFFYWPRAGLAMNEPNAPGQEMAVYRIGWSQEEALPFVIASVAIVGCLVPAMIQVLGMTGLTRGDETFATLVGLGIGGALWVISVPIWKKRSSLVASRPVASLASGGMSVPGLALVEWAEVLSFYAGDRERSSGEDSGFLKTLHFESRASASSPQRFIALFRGFSESSFLIRFADGKTNKSDWRAVTLALERYRKKVREVLPAAADGDVSAFQVVETHSASEFIVPQGGLRRVLTGILSLLLVAAVCLLWYFCIPGIASDLKNTPIPVTVFLALLALIGWGFFRLGIVYLVTALKGTARLVVTDQGVLHHRFGMLDWADIERVCVYSHEDDNNERGDKDRIYWLCAEVAESAYRRAVKGKGLIERYVMGRAKRRLTESKWCLPLIAFGEGEAVATSLNGVLMPPEKVENICIAVNSFINR